MTENGDLNALPELASSLKEARGLSNSFALDLQKATQQMRLMDGETRRLSRSLSSSLRSAFDSAVFGGAKLGDVLRGLLSDVAGNALDSALRPLQGALGAGISGAIGSLTGALTPGFAFAEGGAFQSGRLTAFAQGGIVDGPTLFPMRSGTGLMGEAGPEAIMPLTRGSDGRLGVAVEGGRAGARPITINISTPDAGSFFKSRSQVSAQIARAVARGEKQL